MPVLKFGKTEIWTFFIERGRRSYCLVVACAKKCYYDPDG
jgi:hypothetical protein